MAEGARGAGAETGDAGSGRRPGLRARKKQQVHDRILDVCGRLFREQGFDETTVEQIAEAAEISRQTFFNYFGSKEAVLSELGFLWLREQADLPKRGIAALGAMNTFEVIRTGIVSQLRAIEQDAEFMRLVFTRSGMMFPHGPHVGGEGDQGRLDRTHRVFDAVTALVRAAQEAGGIRTDVPAEQVAEIYASVMLITIRLWLTDYWGTGESLVERGLRTLAVLEAGLQPQAAQDTTAAQAGAAPAPVARPTEPARASAKKPARRATPKRSAGKRPARNRPRKRGP